MLAQVQQTYSLMYINLIFQLCACLTFSPSHACSLLMRLHSSMGALPGRDQSYSGAHPAGVAGGVFHEAVLLPQKLATLGQFALLSHQHQRGAVPFVAWYVHTLQSI